MANDSQMPERIWAFEDYPGQGAVPRGGMWCDEQSECPEGSPMFVRSDLCASGQQVRALMERLPRYDIDVDGDIMPDPTGEYLERSDVLAALTPAPQPEGQVMDGWIDDKTFIEPVSPDAPQPEAGRHRADCPECKGTGERDSGGTHPWGAPAMLPCDCDQSDAAPTAQEAVSTEDELDEAWKSGFNAGFGEAKLTTHPPQPSETVAEALRGLMAAYKSIADSGDAGFWKAEETPEYQSAEAALRALKGGDA